MDRLKSPSLVFLLSFFTLSLLLGCGGDDNPIQSGQTSTIEGRVTDDAGNGAAVLAKSAGPIEGAAITVVEIQANGSLKTVSTGQVQTNANGEFAVETELDGVSGLIVVAEKGNAKWKAVVTSQVQRGRTTKCQPHNDESTAEADTKEELRRRGKSEDDVSYADVAAFINAEVAANVKGNASAITQLAIALEAEAEARTAALLDASIGATQSQISAANSAKLAAQATLETALNAAAGSQTAIDAAFETYNEAIINAYVDAGISAEAYARAKSASTKALSKNSASMSAQARFSLNKKASEIRARAIDRACRAQFTAIGAASAQVNAVASAGATLRTSIMAATTDNEITAAFEAYHDEVLNELRTSISAHATAITTVDATINGVGGAKLTLETALSAAVSTNAVIDAYVAFYNSVRALVQGALVTASETEINVATEVLILTNL